MRTRCVFTRGGYALSLRNAYSLCFDGIQRAGSSSSVRLVDKKARFILFRLCDESLRYFSYFSPIHSSISYFYLSGWSNSLLLLSSDDLHCLFMCDVWG